MIGNEQLTPGSRASSADVRARWDEKAGYWDEYFGEGNEFHNVLIAPATERLLNAQPGETVLDIACGNGAFSRRMATLGARVIAFDFSPVFVERARARSAEYADRIDYHVLDATDESALRALGEGRFDAAVASMALMDMTEITPLARALRALLKPEGRFVFSVQHPCFNSNAVVLLAETVEEEGKLSFRPSIKINGYLDVPPGLGGGVPGEPNPHYYFHRPLWELFGAFFWEGFVLDGMEEPGFDGASDRPLTWSANRQIPPVLAARLRPTRSP